MTSFGTRGVILFWTVIILFAVAALAAWITTFSGSRPQAGAGIGGNGAVVSLPPAVSGSADATSQVADAAAPASTIPAGIPAGDPASLLQPPAAAVPLWQQRSVAVAEPAGRPMIAVVIDDLGLDRVGTARAVALPGPLTMAWLAYADDLQTQTAAAIAAGHEMLLHLPMEPVDPDNDPGPDALRVGMASSEIRRIVRQGLERVPGVVGVNNHMGSRFTADRAGMVVVLATIREAELAFVDSRTTGQSVAAPLAAQFGVAFASRDVFIDDDRDPAVVAERLADVERIAREQGHAIAIGHPVEVTLDALESWLPGLTERGFVLVPVSAVIRAGQAPPAVATAP
ncbi:MAG: divergent polysaccharide deacetylase family protein [Alphaproteobacteria bacterium]